MEIADLHDCEKKSWYVRLKEHVIARDPSGKTIRVYGVLRKATYGNNSP